MNRRKIIAIIILIVILGLIWGQSMADAEESQNESNLVGSFIGPFLELFVGKGNVTDHLVRKLAHFTEYAALGLALGNAAKAFGKTKLPSYAVFFLCGMAAAFIDEGIQLFSPGRSAQISDVLLDSSGVLFGMICFLPLNMFELIQNNIYRQKSTDSEKRSALL